MYNPNNYESFKQEILDKIKEYLPADYADATVEIRAVKKNNIELDGLMIQKPQEKVVPTIYVNSYYKEYETGAMSMKKTLESLADIRQKNVFPVSERDIHSFAMNYEKIKENLSIQIVNTKMNQERLESCPHKQIEDFSVLYRVSLKALGEDSASFVVTNEMLQQYGITSEQLHQDAMKSSQTMLPAKLQSMYEAMRGTFGNLSQEEMDGFDIMEEEMEKCPMYVLSNRSKINGAAVVLYDGVLDDAGRKLQTDKMFILPSSIHEVLLIPDDGNINVSELKDMVQSVNGSEVSPDEILSNQVYQYDCIRHKFSIASDGMGESVSMEDRDMDRYMEHVARDVYEKDPSVAGTFAEFYESVLDRAEEIGSSKTLSELRAKEQQLEDISKDREQQEPSFEL